MAEDYRDFNDMMNEAGMRTISAIDKYPQPQPVSLKLAEEAGEVAGACVRYREGRGSLRHVREEMIDVVVCLIRLWHEGDQVNGIPPVQEWGNTDSNRL